MNLIRARNVHRVLPAAILYLQKNGVPRESRNGPVFKAPGPVTTQYEMPTEKVLFWPERDANPFLHLYESMWMLQGRKDVKPLLRYAKSFSNFSNDGETLHGAYGYRWRGEQDQLDVVRNRLVANQDDRRAVVQMWDHHQDLMPGDAQRDVPCNMIVTFQVNDHGALDMVVFNRSNDIIWGAYGANAVHFGFLLEYMAMWIGVPVGVYYQVSVNWHGYLNTLTPLLDLPRKAYDSVWSVPAKLECPYSRHEVRVVPLVSALGTSEQNEEVFSREMNLVMAQADEGWSHDPLCYESEFATVLHLMLKAHEVYRENIAPFKFELAKEVLLSYDPTVDWIKAGIEWIDRREKLWEQK